MIASYGTTLFPSSYLLPTTYLPSSYVVPTSYVPSSYVVPTTYVPSSYILPTAYYTTSYSRTSYVPTFYKPTLFEYPRVCESSYVVSGTSNCDPVPCDTPIVASTYGNSRGFLRPIRAFVIYGSACRRRVEIAKHDERGSDHSVERVSLRDGRASPVVTLRRTEEGGGKAGGQSAEASRCKRNKARRSRFSRRRLQGHGRGGLGTERRVQKPPPTPSRLRRPRPGCADDQDLKPAPKDNGVSTRRDNLKPIYSNTSPLLRNSAMSWSDGSSPNQVSPLARSPLPSQGSTTSAIRRSGMTNAFGGFAIRLADGEWNVNVQDAQRASIIPFGRSRSITAKSWIIRNGEKSGTCSSLIDPVDGRIRFFAHRPIIFHGASTRFCRPGRGPRARPKDANNIGANDG